MKRNKFLYLSIFSVCIFKSLHSQNIELLKFKKKPALIYFFQKGVKSDTIVKGGGDLFYLLVPDSLKNTLSVYTENGQLRPTDNDSLVEFCFLKGYKYESVYARKETQDLHENKYQVQVLMNGTSEFSKEKVRIQIVNRKNNEVLIENVFYFKN